MTAAGPTIDPQSSSGTSRSLIARVRSDDAAAWERLVGLYAPLVFHWCRRATCRTEDASDVFQEVFQAVAHDIGGFRKEQPGDTFRGWLRTITRSKALDHFRRRRGAASRRAGPKPAAAGQAHRPCACRGRRQRPGRRTMPAKRPPSAC